MTQPERADPEAGRGVAVVTGGSRGIGAACARLLARSGWAVCLTYRTEKDTAWEVARGCDEAAREYHAEHGLPGAPTGAIAVAADLEDPACVPGVFTAADHLGRLTVLVNNAGVIDRVARVDELTPERLTRMFTINTISAILRAGEAVRRMSTRHGGTGGSIVNISSAAARLGSPELYVDSARRCPARRCLAHRRLAHRRLAVGYRAEGGRNMTSAVGLRRA
ncbi:short chain dehydrogenase [Frankia sp. EI5c]|uniref:SDR family NAD(P)-dependent oxidoreductase n=1 Tax=Frankia sp. EI5c TaxID=683316 RepID=UPI0007C31A43|nr:SDR family NAD(P)-dependent oxidoreductase [Frankia sp. EI5c]OAA25577.1 short chain dehydrogenase [Frankia sp. EI5c]